MQQMTINLLVTIVLAFEAVEWNCGVGSLPIDIIEALAFQGMITWTWSRVLLILNSLGNSKYNFPTGKNCRYLLEASMLSKVKGIGA